MPDRLIHIASLPVSLAGTFGFAGSFVAFVGGIVGALIDGNEKATAVGMVVSITALITAIGGFAVQGLKFWSDDRASERKAALDRLTIQVQMTAKQDQINALGEEVERNRRRIKELEDLTLGRTTPHS